MKNKNAIDLFASRSEEIAELKKEIEQLQNELLQVGDQIEKAEDYDRYAALSEKKIKAEFALKTKQKRLTELSSPLPVADAKSALRPFYDDYNRKFSEAMAAYKKARHALYKQFIDLVELQRTATEIRTKAGLACGFPDELYVDLDCTQYADLGRFPTISAKKARVSALRQCPDTEFFISTGEMPADLDNYIFRVTMHKG